MLMGWGDVWMTVGQASSKTVIDQMIDSDDLGWGH